jgi:branched-chain amino acid transport system permease protein
VDFYISQIVQGIATGCIYGMLGISIMFIYRSARVFNFAQGELATAAVFWIYLLMNHVPAWLAVAAGLGLSFAAGMAIELLVLRMIRGRHELNVIITTIGLFTICNNLDGLIYGYDPVTFPSPIPSDNITVHGVTLSYQSLWIISCAAMLSALLYGFFKFTKTGLAFQGLAENPAAARLKGIRVGYLLAVGWGLAAVIGTLAGLLAAPSMFLHTNMMEAVFLYAFAASVIGGLQSSFGALIGGVLVGVTENLAGTWEVIGSDLKTAFVYALVVVFLIVRPRGLLGRDEPRRI